MEKAILATDLSKHFKHRKRYKDLVEGGSFKLENADHKVCWYFSSLSWRLFSSCCAILLWLLLTFALSQSLFQHNAVLLSSSTGKRHPFIKHLTQLSEFFDQGDLEKALGTSSTELQDLLNRQKVNELPKLQIGFLDFVAGPVYETLSLQWSDLEVISVLHTSCWSHVRFSSLKCNVTGETGTPFKKRVLMNL